MSKSIGPNLKRFIETTMAKHGISLLAAASLPEAKLAEQADFKEAQSADGTRSTAEWLRNYDGKGFQSKEDREEAFADPAYKTSESYRQAVARMAQDSSDEIMGLNSKRHKGTSNEEMLHAARHEAYQEKRNELVAKASKGSAADRLALMEFYVAPENQAILAEYEKTERELKPLEFSLRDAQESGQRVGTPLSLEEKPTDAAEGEAQALNQHPSGFVVTPWNS